MYSGFDLSGKVAVLTGSTSGMGLEIARGLAACGARIVVSSHLPGEVARAVEALSAEGCEVKGAPCDITRDEDIATFGARAKAAFGRTDILFCLAAPPARLGALSRVPVEAFDALLAHTVGAAHQIIGQFLPDMADRRDGSIVVMSSIAGLRANPALGGYGIAKAAMDSLVRHLAVEWGPSNIRVNAIAPALVRTRFSEEIWGDPQHRETAVSGIPLRRIAEPSDMVGAALLLASPAGAYISG